MSNFFDTWAGDEARTRDLQLGRLSLYQLSYTRFLWGEQDSNLRRNTPTDLQSVLVGRLSISPNYSIFKKNLSGSLPEKGLQKYMLFSTNQTFIFNWKKYFLDIVNIRPIKRHFIAASF